MYKQLKSQHLDSGVAKGATVMFLVIWLTVPTHASWLSDAKKQVVDKPIEWAGKQSGITPTDKKVKDAADETKKTNQQVQTVVADLKPRLDETLTSVKDTSKGVSNLIRILTWPLVILALMLAAWAAAKAVGAWRVAAARKVTV